MLSPLIENGKWSLTATGDLQRGRDIATQMPVTVLGHRCIYGDDMPSELNDYLINKVVPLQRNIISNVVKLALQVLITPKIISNVTISPRVFNTDDIFITINALAHGEDISFSWSNLY